MTKIRAQTKQETLEEAAERALWQEQNSDKKWTYEDLKQAFYAENEGWVNFDLWFEQFEKNKKGDL